MRLCLHCSLPILLAVKTTLYKNEAKTILWIDDNKTFLKYAEIMRYDPELI